MWLDNLLTAATSNTAAKADSPVGGRRDDFMNKGAEDDSLSFTLDPMTAVSLQVTNLSESVFGYLIYSLIPIEYYYYDVYLTLRFGLVNSIITYLR